MRASLTNDFVILEDSVWYDCDGFVAFVAFFAFVAFVAGLPAMLGGPFTVADRALPLLADAVRMAPHTRVPARAPSMCASSCSSTRT